MKILTQLLVREILNSLIIFFFHLRQRKIINGYRLVLTTLKWSSKYNRSRGITSQKRYDNDVIVTLTTYGKRLNDVYLAIESIMCGVVLPNRIVLWLDNKMQYVELPKPLIKQVGRGLEIYYTDDIGSYKKLIPSLDKFPDDIFVTIDDDVLYSPQLLKNLLESFDKYPHHIHANRVHEMLFDKQGKLKSYLEWNSCINRTGASPLYFQTGVGGVLYPSHCFYTDVLRQNIFTDLCKYGDDIWFYTMGILNGYTVYKSYTDNKNGEDYISLPEVKEEPLGVKNTDVNFCRNDEQIRKVFEKYNIYSLLSHT